MRHRNAWLALVALAGLALAAGRAGAQSGGGYDLSWNSLDCGSETASTGSAYSLRSTIGQAESGGISGGAYSMQGGWRVSTDAAPPDVTQGDAPLVFRLHGNSPNPFANSTVIAFSLPRETGVLLQVFDLSGRRVHDVLAQRLGAGRHQVVWDGRTASGRRAAHGIYLLRLQAGELRAHRKLALVP